MRKIWKEWFGEETWTRKTFELRLADFACSEGDTLVLKEWDPELQKYTGRQKRFTITYVTNTKTMEALHSREELKKHGLYVMSVKPQD